MAEVAVAAVINKTVEVAANLIVGESSRLYWLPEDTRWLESQMRHMQAYKEVAEAKQVTNPQVASLVKDIRDLAQDAEDILDTFLPNIEEHRSPSIITRTPYILPYGLNCSKFAKEIGKIKRRGQAIDDNRKIYGIEDTEIGDGKLNLDPRTMALHFDEPAVVGLDEDIVDLKMKLLTEEGELLFVAIVGMVGVGKTTLTKKVFKGVRGRFSAPHKFSSPNLQTPVGIRSYEVNYLGPDSFPNLRKFEPWGATNDAIKQLCGPEPMSIKLETFCLPEGTLTETLDLSRYKNMGKLEIGLLLQQLPQIKEFPPNLLKLVLVGNHLEEDTMQILKKLPKLKILKLGMNSYTGRKLDCSGAGSFPQLEILNLRHLFHAEELTDGDKRGMHKLRQAIISNCPKPQRIPE